jgi:cell division GTPase FtsZ
MGGGTGSGTVPFVARALKELYDIPIIAIAVLPASGEGKEGKHLAWNAWSCIKKLTEHIDGFILVDNEKISYKKNIEYHFPKYNKYIARCITDLIAGIIIEKIDLSKLKVGRELKDIDFRDIVATSSFQSNGENKPGFAAIGRASRQVRGLVFYMPIISKFPGGYQNIDVREMLKKAMASLSLEIKDSDLQNSMKNLVNLRVPDYYLEQEDRLDTGTIKQYMEQYSKTGWKMLGISRTKRDLASVTVLLTFLPDRIERLVDIEDMARKYGQEKGLIDYSI